MIYEGKILEKGTMAHAIFYPGYEVDILFPVKCVIVDVLMKDTIPSYKIKIVKFYDSFNFIKKHLQNSYIKGEKNSEVINIPKSITTIEKLEEWFAERRSAYPVLAAPFVAKTKNEMLERFHALNDYIISRKLRYIRELTCRPLYKGQFRSQNIDEFNQRMRNAFISNFESDEEFMKKIREI